MFQLSEPVVDVKVSPKGDSLEIELDGYWGVQEILPGYAQQGGVTVLDEGKTSITLVRIDQG